MHEDFSSKHMGETSGVLLQQFLVVFTRKLINIDLQPSHWIIIQHIPSASCVIETQNTFCYQYHASESIKQTAQASLDKLDFLTIQQDSIFAETKKKFIEGWISASCKSDHNFAISEAKKKTFTGRHYVHNRVVVVHKA
jgi:hypothetical protein